MVSQSRRAVQLLPSPQAVSPSGALQRKTGVSPVGAGVGACVTLSSFPHPVRKGPTVSYRAGSDKPMVTRCVSPEGATDFMGTPDMPVVQPESAEHPPRTRMTTRPVRLQTILCAAFIKFAW